MTLTKNDLELLSKKGISERKVNEQIGIFKEGIPFVQLEKAVTVGEGISKFDAEEEKWLIERFDKAQNTMELLKFVPASGAASRMFKALSLIHISEPTRRTPISYAVFCLKK